MKISLGAMLAIGLAGLQFLAVLGVVFSSYITSERALIGHARDLLSDVGTNTIEHSKGFLNPAHGAAELAARLAQNDVVASDDPQLLERLLFQQLQLSPQFAGIFYGNRDGGFVYVMRSDGPGPFRSKIITKGNGGRQTELIWRDDSFNVVERRFDPDDTYDPRTRPWYVRAKGSMGTIWTDPYIFFSSQQPGITLAAPVFDGGTDIHGVMGVDIEISSISHFLSRLRIGKSGKALIIHRNGDVIAHPDPKALKARNEDGTLRFSKVWEFEDPIVRTAFSSLFQQGAVDVPKEVSSQFAYMGAVYVSVVKPIISDDLPWTIAVYAPEDDFTAVIKRNRTTNIWIAAAVALATALIGLVAAEYIYRPVRAFAVRSALISQGELDPSQPPPRTYKELERANAALMEQIAARKETEWEYGQTFERSSRAMGRISPDDGRFLHGNPTFCKQIGYSNEELLRLRFVDLLAPGEANPFAAGVGRSKDHLPVNQEIRLTRKNGTVLWVNVNAIMIQDQAGNNLHAVVVTDDISESKAREGQIQQLNRDLTRLARGHTMGQMASGLAHELNQPLTAIAQNADAAQSLVRGTEAADAELRTILREIEGQSLRAGDIIRALRSFVRKDEQSRTVFDLAELIEQSQRLMQVEAAEAGVQIDIQVGRLPAVEANRVQVAQILVNLLRNAVEAIAPTSITHRRVTVRAVIDAGRVRVDVTDTGPGIDPLINLFAEFETTKPAGMGLGLSICRSIAEANGGRLWHDAGYHSGARFSFTLPVHSAAEAGSDAA